MNDTKEYPVLIHIQSTARRDAEELLEKMNLLVAGKLELEEEHALIRYDEMMDGHTEHVSMELCDDAITVNRQGEFSSQMIFRMGCRSEGAYHTPYGDIVLGVFCNRLSYDINGLEGKLNISYQLDMNGRFAAVHTIEIDLMIQPDEAVS